MTKEKKEIEYPDAPSGYVTLYNYKEPFMPFKYEDTGFGYEGVLLFDGVSDKIQCHFCGDWFQAMGSHLHKEHNMKARDYKEITGLRQTTALVSETLRAKMIANGMSIRLKNLQKGGKKTEEQKEKIRQTLLTLPRQTQNETGTCPKQIIDRLQKRAKELGRTPTTDEITFIQVLRKVYGTYSQACRIAGLDVREEGQVLFNPRTITQEQIVNFVREFWIKNHEFPRFKDCPSDRLWDKYKVTKKEIDKQVLFGEGQYQKTGVKIFYTVAELLQILSIFKEKNKRNPSISDCKRGLLPHASRYYYHFGSFKNALSQI
jgi:hypothetical protein